MNLSKIFVAFAVFLLLIVELRQSFQVDFRPPILTSAWDYLCRSLLQKQAKRRESEKRLTNPKKATALNVVVVEAKIVVVEAMSVVPAAASQQNVGDLDRHKSIIQGIPDAKSCTRRPVVARSIPEEMAVSQGKILT